MQAPFLCLISFLERCRYLSILTRVVTAPGEYVQLPLNKGMINRRSGKIYQLYSRPLYIPWGQVDRGLSPSFAAEMGSQKSFANVPSFTPFTHKLRLPPPTPPPSHGAVPQPISKPSKRSLPVHQPVGWDDFCLVWDLLFFSFSWHVSSGHVSSVTL